MVQHKNKNQIRWIDAAKGISIFVIVLGHCADKSGEDNILLHLCMFTGVGVFFLLSGMTFCFRTDSGKVPASSTFPWFDNRPFPDFLKRLFTRILFPYFFWSFISIMIYAAAGPAAAAVLHSDRHNFSVWNNFAGMLYANSGTGYMEWNRPLWFLPCLAVVEVIWFGILKLLTRIRRKASLSYSDQTSRSDFQDDQDSGKNLGKGNAGRNQGPGDYSDGMVGLAASAVLYGCGIVLPLILFYCLVSRGIRLHLPWETETAISVMPYFGIGRLLRGSWTEKVLKKCPAETEESGKKTAAVQWRSGGTKPDTGRTLLPAAAAVLLVLECVLLRNTQYADFRADRFSSLPLFLPDAVAGVLFTLMLAVSLQDSRVLQYIGKRTLAILAMHKFPVMFLKLLLRLAGFEPETLPLMILTDLLMAAVSILLCLAVERVISRFAPAVFGK